MAGLIPLLALAPLLVAVAYFDLRFMRIPNILVLIAIGLFVLAVPFLGWHEAGLRAIAALAVFAIGFILFALNLFGGGDVKMMAALMFFVPSETWSQFGLVFSAAMLAGMVGVTLLRLVPAFSGTSWVSLQQRGSFPMGISIAMAGLLHPFAVLALV